MIIYLVHFMTPYKRISHYIGSTEDLDKRIDRHQKGRGAKVLKLATQSGVEWLVVRVWQTEDRALEKSLKRNRNHKDYCMICEMERRGYGNHGSESGLRITARSLVSLSKRTRQSVPRDGDA